MEASVITSQIVYLGIFVLIGFFGVLFKYIKPSVSDGVSVVLTRLALPALVLSSFSTFELDAERLKNGMYMLIASYLLIFLLLAIGKAFAKILGLSGVSASAHAYLTACGNVSFMGYPIITAVLGTDGLYYAMLYVLANDSVVWSLSLYSLAKLTGKKNENVILKLLNPNTISLIAGFIIMIFGVKFPTFIAAPLKTLGNCTIPLSMLFIGMTLATIKPTKLLNLWKSLFIVIIKMLIVPIILIFALSFFNKFGIIASTGLMVLILLCAMPSGTAYAVLAKSYGGDYEYAAQSISLTTICSFFTIPLIYYLITNLGTF